MAKAIKLNEININNLYQLKQPAKLVLAAVVTVAVLVLAYFVIFSGQINQIDQLQQEEDKLKETYTQKSDQAARLDALTAELAQIHSSFNVLLKQLPTQAEIPNLIQELHQAAASNGLRMDSVEPKPVVNDSTIQKLPYSIALTGSYAQISQFTRDVGQLSRIVTLDTLNLKRDEKSGALTLTALANTYKALNPNQKTNKEDTSTKSSSESGSQK